MQLIQKALTFDDVLLIPAHSTVLPRDVSLATRLTHDYTQYPIGFGGDGYGDRSPIGIALAQEGGIGIIHKNMSIEAQAALRCSG
jgi:IMP dehydrogenase